MKKIGLILSAAAVVLFVGDGSAMKKSRYGGFDFKARTQEQSVKHVQELKARQTGVTQKQARPVKAPQKVARKNESIALEKERSEKLEALEIELATHKQEINTLKQENNAIKQENKAIKDENAAIEAQIAEIIGPQQTSTSN